MKEADVSGAANILKASWDECWGIMERAVARGRAAKEHRVPALVGVDEKAARKGQSYVTLVYDIVAGSVEYIADDRKQTSLDPYFASFSAEERKGIIAVAMDMWEPYVNSVSANLDDAEQKIVFDKFQVASHVRWKIRDGRRLLVMMLGGSCVGFGDAAGGVGVEQLAA